MVVTGTYCASHTNVYIDGLELCSFHVKSTEAGEWCSRGTALDCQSRDGGSIQPTAVSKLGQFHSPHICLSEDTKTGGPFYLVLSIYLLCKGM